MLKYPPKQKKIKPKIKVKEKKPEKKLPKQKKL